MKISSEDFENASLLLNIAKYIDPNNYRYYYYFGKVLQNKGLVAEANKNFEHSLELNPDFNLAKEELSI